MRKYLAALLVALSVVTLTAAAGATAPEKKKPPVKLDGDVNNKGVAKVTGDAAEIEADDFYFKKTFLKGKAGSTVGVTVKNESDTAHTFTIDDQGIDEELAPGDSIDVDVMVPANGTVANFYCSFHLSSGMQGAFFSAKGATADRSKSSDTGSDTGSDSGSGGGYGY